MSADTNGSALLHHLLKELNQAAVELSSLIRSTRTSREASRKARTVLQAAYRESMAVESALQQPDGHGRLQTHVVTVARSLRSIERLLANFRPARPQGFYEGGRLGIIRFYNPIRIRSAIRPTIMRALLKHVTVANGLEKRLQWLLDRLNDHLQDEDKTGVQPKISVLESYDWELVWGDIRGIL